MELGRWQIFKLTAIVGIVGIAALADSFYPLAALKGRHGSGL